MDLSTITLGGVALVATSKGLNKLLESLPDAIRMWYEPVQQNRLQSAEIKSLEKSLEVMNAHPELDFTCNSGDITISNQTKLSVWARAQSFDSCKKVQEQYNRDAIISNACAELQNEDCVSDEPVDQYWMSRFFNLAADASDETIQMLWGKILAGEIKQPKSFSFRTLDAIRTLTTDEAKFICDKFQNVFRYADGTFYIPNYEEYKKMFALNIMNILKLEEMGLISSTPLTNTLENIDIPFPVFYSDNFICRLQPNKKIEIQFYRLTSLGTEILKVIDTQLTEDRAIAFANCMNKNGKKVSVYKFDYFDEKQGARIYKEEDILPN